MAAGQEHGRRPAGVRVGYHAASHCTSRILHVSCVLASTSTEVLEDPRGCPQQEHQVPKGDAKLGLEFDVARGQCQGLHRALMAEGHKNREENGKREQEGRGADRKNRIPVRNRCKEGGADEKQVGIILISCSWHSH